MILKRTLPNNFQVVITINITFFSVLKFMWYLYKKNSWEHIILNVRVEAKVYTAYYNFIYRYMVFINIMPCLSTWKQLNLRHCYCLFIQIWKFWNSLDVSWNFVGVYWSVYNGNYCLLILKVIGGEDIAHVRGICNELS